MKWKAQEEESLRKHKANLNSLIQRNKRTRGDEGERGSKNGHHLLAAAFALVAGSASLCGSLSDTAVERGS